MHTCITEGEKNDDLHKQRIHASNPIPLKTLRIDSSYHIHLVYSILYVISGALLVFDPNQRPLNVRQFVPFSAVEATESHSSL